MATAIEQAGPGEDPNLEAILPHIPDWDDFAGRFLRSGGAFVVATVDGAVAGCVGVTPIADGVCEMNRLWVRGPFRAGGLGRRLAVASMDAARRLGFTRMLLDVIPAGPVRSRCTSRSGSSRCPRHTSTPSRCGSSAAISEGPGSLNAP